MNDNDKNATFDAWTEGGQHITVQVSSHRHVNRAFQQTKRRVGTNFANFIFAACDEEVSSAVLDELADAITSEHSRGKG